jgi:hypothetical protein
MMKITKVKDEDEYYEVKMKNNLMKMKIMKITKVKMKIMMKITNVKMKMKFMK